MLRRWEAGDPEVRALWEKMNNWVYAGFDETYRRMGVSFDKIYYESDTYLVGRDTVLEGLEKGLFTARRTTACGPTSRPTAWTTSCCCAATAPRSI